MHKPTYEQMRREVAEKSREVRMRIQSAMGQQEGKEFMEQAAKDIAELQEALAKLRLFILADHETMRVIFAHWQHCKECACEDCVEQAKILDVAIAESMLLQAQDFVNKYELRKDGEDLLRNIFNAAKGGDHNAKNQGK